MSNVHVPHRLYARPSLLEGVARLLDIGATLQEYNSSNTEQKADFVALRNDWRAVGADFKKVVNEYEQQSVGQ